MKYACLKCNKVVKPIIYLCPVLFIYDYKPPTICKCGHTKFRIYYDYN